MDLSPRERKSLMARTHALEPRVRVGGKGLTETVVAEVAKALAREPLLKVALPGDRALRHALAAELASRCEAALVGEVGKIAVLYRPSSAEGAAGAADEPSRARPSERGRGSAE
jgi:RNA-binding protein